jgi:hypothetical protein
MAAALAAAVAAGRPLEAQAVAPRVASPRAAAPATAGDADLRDAYQRRARNAPIEVTAVVVKLLPDDREGLQHQRFLIRAAGLSILVAHNTGLAPRAPVQAGDTIRIRGEYVWNNKGGVLHWTHHDPRGKHPAGFIDVRGRRVQ